MSLKQQGVCIAVIRVHKKLLEKTGQKSESVRIAGACLSGIEIVAAKDARKSMAVGIAQNLDRRKLPF